MTALADAAASAMMHTLAPAAPQAMMTSISTTTVASVAAAGNGSAGGINARAAAGDEAVPGEVQVVSSIGRSSADATATTSKHSPVRRLSSSASASEAAVSVGPPPPPPPPSLPASTASPGSTSGPSASPLSQRSTTLSVSGGGPTGGGGGGNASDSMLAAPSIFMPTSMHQQHQQQQQLIPQPAAAPVLPMNFAVPFDVKRSLLDFPSGMSPSPLPTIEQTPNRFLASISKLDMEPNPFEQSFFASSNGLPVPDPPSGAGFSDSPKPILPPLTPSVLGMGSPRFTPSMFERLESFPFPKISSAGPQMSPPQQQYHQHQSHNPQQQNGAAGGNNNNVFAVPGGAVARMVASAAAAAVTNVNEIGGASNHQQQQQPTTGTMAPPSNFNNASMRSSSATPSLSALSASSSIANAPSLDHQKHHQHLPQYFASKPLVAHPPHPTLIDPSLDSMPSGMRSLAVAAAAQLTAPITPPTNQYNPQVHLQQNHAHHPLQFSQMQQQQQQQQHVGYLPSEFKQPPSTQLQHQQQMQQHSLSPPGPAGRTAKKRKLTADDSSSSLPPTAQTLSPPGPSSSGIVISKPLQPSTTGTAAFVKTVVPRKGRPNRAAAAAIAVVSGGAGKAVASLARSQSVVSSAASANSHEDDYDEDDATASTTRKRTRVKSEPGVANAGAGGGGGSMDGMDDDERRKAFLERNRQAALKCRQKKKLQVKKLEDTVTELRQTNEAMMKEAHRLREELLAMKTLLLEHRDCPVALANGLNVDLIEATFR